MRQFILKYILAFFSRTWLKAAIAAVLLTIAASTPTHAVGTLNVRVTSAGQPVPNVTVCIGVAGDLNLFHQGVTNTQGRVSFGSVPQEPFVATASLSGRGTQRSFSPRSPNVQLLNVDLVLPSSGGPSCPQTPAGPSRKNISQIQEMPQVSQLERFPSVTIRQTEFCFGAIGAQCGQPQTDIPATALCAGGSCFINGGSWEHDECCFRNRHAMWCELDPLRQAAAASDTTCVNAWNKAVRLTRKGLFWRRTVDFSRGNSSGTVEFPLYCAPTNSLVLAEDQNKCCSGQTRALNTTEAVAAAVAGETLRACR